MSCVGGHYRSNISFTDYISYNVDVENSDTSLPYIVIIIKNGRHRQKLIHNDNKRM